MLKDPTLYFIIILLQYRNCTIFYNFVFNSILIFYNINSTFQLKLIAYSSYNKSANNKYKVASKLKNKR